MKSFHLQPKGNIFSDSFLENEVVLPVWHWWPLCSRILTRKNCAVRCVKWIRMVFLFSSYKELLPRSKNCHCHQEVKVTNSGHCLSSHREAGFVWSRAKAPVYRLGVTLPATVPLPDCVTNQELWPALPRTVRMAGTAPHGEDGWH